MQDGPEGSSELAIVTQRSTTKPHFSVARAVSFMHGGRKLIKYFLAGRRAFAKATFVSMAVDASRVARRKTLLGVLALPGNVAMWATPQATGGLACRGASGPEKNRACFTKNFM